MISVRQAGAALAALGCAVTLAMSPSALAADKSAPPPSAAPISAASNAVIDGGFTADEIAAVMQDRGYAAQIGKDSEGDPKIRSGAQGSSYTIFFYGCRKGPRCTSIEFSLGFHIEGGMTMDQINSWNRRNRFGRAYLDDDKDPWLEMDVDVEHGFTPAAVSNNLDTWDAVISNFKHFLACAQKTTTDNCPAA